MTQKKQWQIFAAIVGLGALGVVALVHWGGLARRAPDMPSESVAITPKAPPQRNTVAPQPAQLPFTTRPNRNAGEASVPNFGGTAAGDAAIPRFGSNPQSGAGPLASNNQTNSGTPYNNFPSGGAAVPSFGSAVGPENAPKSGQVVAIMPMLAPDSSDPDATAKHYLKQICGDRVPTLQDWQQLVEMKLPDADKWLHAPIGPGHFVMALCLDHQSNLWAGTEGEGLFRFSPKTGMWTQFVATKKPLPDGNPPIPATAVECGLGDNYVYALACDHQGRMWIGHLNHGISVYNGEIFQCYEAVSGLSHLGSLNGPLGERVFHFSVAPAFTDEADAPKLKDPRTGKENSISGSVWTCTSAGLAIYFPLSDSWSYLARSEGVPSDQANSVAVGADGTVYLATQCNGIAITSPRQNYSHWQQIVRRAEDFDGSQIADDLPTVPTGVGLPSNLINDIAVDKAGVVYAATTAGVAMSADNGDHWQFVRGTDYSGKVRQRNGGPPRGWNERPGAFLAEDYSTSLTIASDDTIYVGHRSAAVDVMSSRARGLVSSLPPKFATSIIALPHLQICGTYGGGLTCYGEATLEMQTSGLASNTASLPKGADVHSPVVTNSPVGGSDYSRAVALLLGQDWRTQGNWLGRYGRYWMVHSGCVGAADLVWGSTAAKVRYAAGVGAGGRSDDSMRGWVSSVYTPDTRSLELSNPYLESRLTKKLTTPEVDRRQSEWDDHGESYSMSHEGPGLFCAVTVPPGVFCLSIYNVNDDAHYGVNSLRDFLVKIKLHPSELPLWEEHGFEHWPELARARVSNAWGGVYTRFVVRGPAQLSISLDRNFSMNTTLNGVFLDPLEAFPASYYSKSVTTEYSGSILPRMEEEPISYALLSKLAFAELARTLQVSDDHGALRAACEFHLGYFSESERLQSQIGMLSSREIEKQLHWDGVTDSLGGTVDGNLVTRLLALRK